MMEKGARTKDADQKILTFNLSNGTEQNVLLGLLVRKGLEDLVNDGLAELSLLTLLLLLLMTSPRVQDGLELGGKGDLLLEGEGLSLELGGLLWQMKEAEGEREQNYFVNMRRRTLEMAKRFLVTSTTSFICSTEVIRSATAWVCSLRVASRRPLMCYKR